MRSCCEVFGHAGVTKCDRAKLGSLEAHARPLSKNIYAQATNPPRRIFRHRPRSRSLRNGLRRPTGRYWLDLNDRIYKIVHDLLPGLVPNILDLSQLLLCILLRLLFGIFVAGGLLSVQSAVQPPKMKGCDL